MPLILPGNVASATAGAYSIANSCRFNGSDESLKLTFGSPTDIDTWTFSCWYKRAKPGNEAIVFTGRLNATNEMILKFHSDDTGVFYDYQSGMKTNKITNAVYRDPAAWFHFHFIYNSGNATAEDRARIYINGVRVTSFATNVNPDQNQDAKINTANEHYIGSVDPAAGSYFLDGYLAEIVFVDGTAVEPTDLGEFDSDSPTIWKPKDISSGITWGNNGFWLDFEDSSALGNDVSGNNNDLTAVNLAAVDQCTDTPTNNFCTMNLLDNFYASYTFSEGNCKIDGTASPTTYRTGTMGVASGKWYWEVNITAAPASNASRIGFTSVVSTSTTHILGSDIYGWAQNGNNGNIEGQASQSGSAASTSYGNSHTTDDIIGIALNLEDDEVKFYKNGTVENSGTAFQINKANAPNGFFFPAIGEASTSNSITAIANFGNPAWALSSAVNDENGYGNFEYSVPSGFLALCTKNLGSDGG